jgi:hypothetical protein
MVLILDLAEVLNLGEALPADGEAEAVSPNRSKSWQGGTEQ